MTGLAQTAKDSTRVARSLTIDEVVVTGTRNETDVRHLPMTISVVNRKVLEQSFQPSVLPVLTEQVPGLFTTSPWPIRLKYLLSDRTVQQPIR